EEVDADACTDIRAVQTLQGLCEVYFREGRQGYAKPYLERLTRLLDQLSDATPLQRLQAQQNLAALHEFNGDLPRAESIWRQVLRQLESEPSCPPDFKAETARKLGMALLQKGQEREAEPLLQTYWELLPEGPESLAVLQIL